MTGDESTTALVQAALDRVLAAKTTVRTILSRSDATIAMTELDDAKRLLLRARTRASENALADIVSADEAARLPVGSIMSQWDEGQPYDGLARYESGWERSGGIGHPASLHGEYIVWHRGPVVVPKVGDIVMTDAALRALPIGAVVRAVGGMRVSYERLHNDAWHAAGDTSPKGPDVVLRCGGVRVLDLGDAAGGTAS